MEQKAWGQDERQEPELAFYRERELGREVSEKTAGIDRHGSGGWNASGGYRKQECSESTVYLIPPSLPIMHPKDPK